VTSEGVSFGLAKCFWPRYAGVAANAEAQRQIDCMLDADAHRSKQFIPLASIVEDLERRPGIEQVEAVVRGPREAKRLAKPAWT